MPINSDTITAPPQLITLVSRAVLKSTLVRSVPRWVSTVTKFSRVGENAK
jgi:hypothetical protein